MSKTVMNKENIYDENENLQEERMTDKSNDSSTTKNILLYRNGDLYFPPKRIVVNKKYIRNWESFLEELTKNLNPRNGAIRDIRTPFHGTRIRSLDDLIANGKYVAVPTGETLKIIDYSKIININGPPNPTKPQPQRLKPLRFSNSEMEKIENRIAQQLYIKSSIIHIFRNGDPFTRAIKVVVKPHEQKHMSVLVKAIEDRVLLQTNKPIRRLYTLTGELVKFAKDIEDGKYYVAASHEPFENIQYGQFLPLIRGGRVHSRRNQVKYLNQLRTPKDCEHTQRTSTSEPTDRSQKSMENPNSKPKLGGNRQQKNYSKPKNDKETAAIKIQAAFRGYHTRREIENSKDDDKEPMVQKRVVHISKKHKKENVEKVEDQVDFTSRSQYNDNKVLRDEKKPQNKLRNNEPKPQYKTNSKLSEIPSNKDNSKDNFKKYSSDENVSLNTERAATKIQASFRGYRTRQNLQRKSENLQRKSLVQQTDKKNASKPVVHQRGRSSVETEECQDLDKAATTIQAGFRGYQARQRFRKRASKSPLASNKQSEDLQKAATKIQAGFRSYRTRKVIKNEANKANRDNAAIQIQAGFRGFKARKEMKEKEMAAKRIQAGYRGYKFRKEKAERERAAEKIQAGYRSYKIRKNMESKKSEKPKNIDPEDQADKRNDAASKIQAAFRGYIVRRGKV